MAGVGRGADVQLIKLSSLEVGGKGGEDKRRQKTDHEAEEGVVSQSRHARGGRGERRMNARGIWGLTFDRGDDGAGRAEDVHGVEALVFADDDLQHPQQLPEALVDGVMQAVVVALCGEKARVESRRVRRSALAPSRCSSSVGATRAGKKAGAARWDCGLHVHSTFLRDNYN